MNRFSDRLITLLISGTIVVIILTAFQSGGMGRNNSLFPKNVNLPEKNLHSGDLIFRNGRGVISNVFRLANQKQAIYSHAGILHQQNGEWYVIHIIDGDKKSSQLRLEPLASFCAQTECSSFGIYRTSLNAQKIDQSAVQAFSSVMSFDQQFDLSTDNQMYCTEFVYKTLKKSSDTFSLPLSIASGRKYVACDDLFLAKGTSLIYTYQY